MTQRLDPVPVFIPEGVDLAGTLPALAEVPFNLVPFRSAEEFAALPPDSRGCVAVAGEHHLNLVGALLVRYGPFPCLILSHEDSFRLREMDAGNEDIDVLVVPLEFPSLPDKLWRLQCARHGARARSLVDRLASPPLLRAAVRQALRQRPLGPHLDGDPPKRTLQSLAVGVGASPDHLSRLARKHGLQFRAILERWLFCQGHLARVMGGGSWEVVAWRLGYTSVSGLSDLVLRNFGTRLRDLSPTTGLPGTFQSWLEEHLSPVAGPVGCDPAPLSRSGSSPLQVRSGKAGRPNGIGIELSDFTKKRNMAFQYPGNGSRKSSDETTSSGVSFLSFQAQEVQDE